MLTAIIQSEHCIGCHRCVEVCPTDAIVGTKQYMHTVLTKHCIGCQLCLTPCPVDCIKIESLNVTKTEKNTRAMQAKANYQRRQIRLQKNAPKSLPIYTSPLEKKASIQKYLATALKSTSH